MGYTIGIDIGGTKICGIVFDGKKAVKELTIVTPKNKKDFLYSIQHLVSFLSAEYEIDRIGVGIAGMVDPQKKVIVQSPNLTYLNGVKLAPIFKGKQIEVDNDANCFARAEWQLGAAKGYNYVIAITFGTGIGSGYVIDGSMYRGSRHMGGEIGHVIADYKSGATLEQVFQKAKHKNDFDHNFNTIADVTAASLIDLVRMLDPEVIVIGGSIGIKHFKQFMPAAKKRMQQLLSTNKLPKLLRAKVPNAGAIGAALLWK